MGQTLAKAAEYTSVAESGEKKLALVKTNEDILNKIITFTETYPGDAADTKLTFTNALTWHSTLKPEDISSWPSGTSNEQTKDGQPCGTIRAKGSGYDITVWNLDHCAIVLGAAGTNKMNETRNCLEANFDPTAVIVGDRFATVSAVADNDAYFRFKEEVRKDQEKEGAAEDPETQEKCVKLSLLSQIRNLDMTMKDEAIQLKQEDFKVSPQSVDDQFNVLQRCAGEDEDNNALEYIAYVQPYNHRFTNGCRAPFWQQVHGHISYIEARPHDTEPIFIVACTSGFFCTSYDKEKNDLTFSADSETYKRLSDLLMDKSPRFAELIGKQHIFERKEERRGILDTTREDREYEREKEAAEQTNRSDRGHEHKGQKGQERKKKENKQKKLTPSLKWKTLGLEEEEQKKDKDEVKYKPKKKKTKEQLKERDVQESYDSFVESESESEEEEEAPERRSDANTDLPSEYWQIQKLVKYLKGGNQTATIIALCAMRDFNLQQETCQLAIRDVGGLEVLINLLDTDEIKCKIGSLKILKDISKNIQIRRAIADLGGLQTMVKILRDPNKELKCLAAETIANVARFRRARRTVRQHGGIKKLVALLDCVSLEKAQTVEQQKDIEVARCGALALWSCSKSTENKQAMRRAGAIPLLAKLLKSTHENMLIPVVGTLQECASEQSYRLAIRTEGMIEDLVNNLKSENPELQMHCASAIFKCAEEGKTRDLVRQYGGLDPLVALLEKNRENKELLAAATGAIWKCSISPENVIRFKELKAIEQLVGLLNDQPEEVLVNVVGALAELAQEKENRLTIRKCGGIPPLVQLLTGTNQSLLVNVTKAVGQCAEEPDNMIVIDKLDGVRLLWSLLKNQNTDVQASAAWAICPCIENHKDAGEMVRSFVGGLELIVGLLESDHIEVLASVCAAIANIASDEENLAVITDHGVVPKLASLTETDDDRLRRHLAEAVARCCNWGNNRVSFGQEQAVAPLVRYLKSKDANVHRSTAKALHQLSKDPDNCITMHEAGVVKPLMEKVGSSDDILQEAAAGCIANIRRLALANEKARTK